ncbi:hypothetical protein V8J82_01300 [Gymnodinialimonas sp. 2305UL16-5]|uniref:hypothetical protein n=1 Tax=Gymnodinialimonas mytili TaxID=3126503 RepID=UPI0030A855BC
MTSAPLFRAQLSGRAEIDLEIRRAEIGLFRNEGATFTAGIWLEATQPGMTLDDRGDKNWDAPVALDLNLGEIGTPDASGAFAPKRREQAVSPTPDDGFFYYWDHTAFVALDWHLTTSGAGQFHINMTCKSAEGHSVTCATEMRGMTVHLAHFTPTDRALLPVLFARSVEEIKVKRQSSGALLARWPEPPR